MRDSDEKEFVWGQVEKVGKGTKANYDAEKKIITFAFNRNPQTSSEQLRKQRERLMQELKELGYGSHMKFNGELIADDVTEQNVVLEKKNGKLLIHLKNKQAPQEDSSTANTDNP